MQEREWFLYVVDRHEGPFSADEVKALVQNGEALPTSYVWKEGYGDWVVMNAVKEFDGAAKFESEARPESTIVTSYRGPDISDVSPSAVVWCLNSGKAYSGPYSLQTIVRKINEGQASVDHSIWREGWSAFVPISGIPELMQQVKPDVQGAGGPEAPEKKTLSSLLFEKHDGVPVRTGRRTSIFFLIAGMMLVAVGGYQALTQGYLDPVLEKANLKEQVKSLGLKPLALVPAFERAFNAVSSFGSGFEVIRFRIGSLLPSSLQSFLAPLRLPEELLPDQARVLREAAFADLRLGAKIAATLVPNEDFNPVFVVTSNLPEGAAFEVVLRGKGGTLLNAFSYEQMAPVVLQKHVAVTPRFSFEKGKPLPKGEYALLVYESAKQNPETERALAALRSADGASLGHELIPAGKAVFAVENYFLGGKKDASYATRLSEFNAQMQAKIAQETGELRQVQATLESMANESASKFFALTKMTPAAKRGPSWAKYDTGYQKLSMQMKAMLSKQGADANGSKVELALPLLHQKALETYELTEKLHQAEGSALLAEGKQEGIQALASAVKAALGDLKQNLLRVGK